MRHPAPGHGPRQLGQLIRSFGRSLRAQQRSPPTRGQSLMSVSAPSSRGL
jgi:hypothetical protein